MPINTDKTHDSPKRTNKRPSLEVYVERLEKLFTARERAAGLTKDKIQRLIRNLVSIEGELFRKSSLLRSELSRYQEFKKSHLKIRVTPGAKNRFRIVGPQLEVMAVDGKQKIPLPTKANDALSIISRCVQKNDVAHFKTKLLEIGQLRKLYEATAQRLKLVVLALDIHDWDQAEDRGRGYGAFCERRESQLFSKILSSFDRNTKAAADLLEKCQDANFEFNSIGGKKKGYKGLSRSFSTPLVDDIKPGYYTQYKVTTKYTAFNMNGKKYTRSINELDSSSNLSIRVTNRILKELGQERFKKPILKWQDENLSLFDEYYEVLQRLALIEERIKDV